MRNNECIIKFLNSDGKVLQTFQKDRKGWFQISSKGIVRRCTAEQTLSHLLPALAGVSRAIVRVERIERERCTSENPCGGDNLQSGDRLGTESYAN